MKSAKTEMVPLSSILMQLAKELASVDLQINAMESVLQREVFGRALTAQQIKDLQGIDHARQVLTCLSIFSQNLSEGTARTIEIDPMPAAKDLALTELANRLASPGSKVELTESEFVDFFEVSEPN